MTPRHSRSVDGVVRGYQTRSPSTAVLAVTPCS